MFDDVLINRAYLNECHECYNNHNLLNLKYLQNVQKELVDKKDFLPLIVRRHLEEDYIIHLKNEGLLKGELYNKLSIPPDRLHAAFWVLQFSLISSFFVFRKSSMVIPQNSIIFGV